MKTIIIIAALALTAACTSDTQPPISNNVVDCAETNSCNYSDGTPK